MIRDDGSALGLLPREGGGITKLHLQVTGAQKDLRADPRCARIAIYGRAAGVGTFSRIATGSVPH